MNMPASGSPSPDAWPPPEFEERQVKGAYVGLDRRVRKAYVEAADEIISPDLKEFVRGACIRTLLISVEQDSDSEIEVPQDRSDVNLLMYFEVEEQLLFDEHVRARSDIVRVPASYAVGFLNRTPSMYRPILASDLVWDFIFREINRRFGEQGMKNPDEQKVKRILKQYNGVLRRIYRQIVRGKLSADGHE